MDTPPLTPAAATDAAPAPDAAAGLYAGDRPAETIAPAAIEGDQAPAPDADADGEPDARASGGSEIDPPSTFDPDARAMFAALPPDMQTALVEHEAQRSRQVTAVTTRAAEAERSAATDAARQVARSQTLYARQVETIANAYAPREPQAWEYQDHASYAQARQQFDAQDTQHRQLVQHATELRAQADATTQQHEQQALIDDARRVQVELPELSDATAYRQLVGELTPVARALGYDDGRIAAAWPSDVLAMKRVAALQVDADKWRAAQSRKMEGVRAARALPRIAQPGVATRPGGQSAPVSIARTLYPDD